MIEKVILILSTILLFATAPSFQYKDRDEDLQGHALTDAEYKYNMGEGFVFFEITQPEELSYTFKANPSIFSPPWNTTLNGAKLVPSDPECGCASFFNADDIEGNIALIERGECSFVSKIIKAQEAGAIAAIIMDHKEDNDELFIDMQQDDTGRTVSINSAFLLGKNGHVIKSTLRKKGLGYAVINIPINITSIPLEKLNQPPWMVW